jgi:antitoxin HicB
MKKRPSSYRIEISYSSSDGYIARVPELPGCSASGKTIMEAITEVQTAMELWLEVAREDGELIPQPVDAKDYSGRVTLRLPKSLHRSLEYEARREGVSLNQLIVAKLAGQTLSPG